jgi:uncharacterized protein
LLCDRLGLTLLACLLGGVPFTGAGGSGSASIPGGSDSPHWFFNGQASVTETSVERSSVVPAKQLGRMWDRLLGYDPWKYAFLPLAVLLFLVPLWREPDPAAIYAANWPILPVAFAAAFLANATAVGGGFLFVPLFIFGYGLDPITALVLALSTQALGMSSGATGWSRTHIDGRGLRIAALAGGLGMALGTFAWTPTPLQVKGVFGWVSLAIGLALVVEMRWRPWVHHGRRHPLGVGYALACLAGGLVTAWVSIGVGEIVVLWLLVRRRDPLSRAIATGVAALAVCSVVGLIFHGTTGELPWRYLAFTAIAATFGGRAGGAMGPPAGRVRGPAKDTFPLA